MKRISFSITLLTLFLLLILLIFLPSKQISSKESLSSLLPNEKVAVSGKVIKETPSKNYKLLKLDNSIELRCDVRCPSYLNKTISAIAVFDQYNDRAYLNILKIKNI